MIGTAAVIAHYDADNRLDPSFLTVVSCLKKICDYIIIVTTCDLKPEDIPGESSILTIIRPNIGYDFYSYRVGVDAIFKIGCFDQLFLLNSSFLILNQQLFTETLTGMLCRLHDYCIVGLTESFQWEHHLQSYLLIVNKEVLLSEWFKEWLYGIEPCNTKLETILSGELGLSRLISKNEVKNSAFFKISLSESIYAFFTWKKWSLFHYGLFQFLRNFSLSHFMNYNPTHFTARPLAERCGIIKTELLRDNPHNLDIKWVGLLTTNDEKGIITKFIDRSRDNYQSSGTGLTIRKNRGHGIPDFHLICTGPLARPGVRIAVVLHFFYHELIDEIYTCLETIIEPFDLFVTTPHEGEVSNIINRYAPLAQTIAVALCENRGRDIGPFIAIYRSRLLEPYQTVLKIHTKRSTYSLKGDLWRTNLFQELIGSSRTVQAILRLLRCGRVGIVGPHSSYLTDSQFWGSDKEKACILLESAGIHFSIDDLPLGFFAGSMFWFTPAALVSLHSISDKDLVFEQEMGQLDGTLSHALERIFCLIARNEGYVTTSLTLGGKEIDKTLTKDNRVPVLDSSDHP